MPEDSGLSDFFGVLADLKEYLPGLTLVGGWVPYVYANFLWRGVRARPVFTSDVDWGVSPGRAFVLRYAPDPGALLSELRGYARLGIFRRARAAVREWFPDKHGRGCLYVRREHGPDEYIEDLAGDIFRRFDSVFSRG